MQKEDIVAVNIYIYLSLSQEPFPSGNRAGSCCRSFDFDHGHVC